MYSTCTRRTGPSMPSATRCRAQRVIGYALYACATANSRPPARVRATRSHACPKSSVTGLSQTTSSPAASAAAANG